MFDFKKFFNGFAVWKGEQFGKILFITILIVVGLVVYYQLTRPTQNIKVGKGGQATFYNAPKRFFIPFAEVGVEKNSDVDLDTYIRGGLRFEF